MHFSINLSIQTRVASLVHPLDDVVIGAGNNGNNLPESDNLRTDFANIIDTWEEQLEELQEAEGIAD